MRRSSILVCLGLCMALAACDGPPTTVASTEQRPVDVDGDGFGPGDGDCDDLRASVGPDAPEICDGLDNDCDELLDEDFDEDGDGWASCTGDCNDADPTLHPDMPELLDGIDNDCSGLADDDANLYSDNDGDGYPEDHGDCDDSNPDIGPLSIDIQETADGAPQGIDDDCDGLVDEAPPPCPSERNLFEPLSYALALDLCNELVDASWGDDQEPDQRNIVSGFGDTYSARSGSDMIVLSSGLAVDRSGMTPSGASFDDASTAFPLDRPHPLPLGDPADGCGQADAMEVYDLSELVLRLRVPANAHSLAFDLNFMSIEFPEFVCSAFDDTFLALVESEAFTGNLALEADGSRVSINVGFFTVCDPAQSSSCTGQDELLGTGFETDQAADEDGGGTGWLTAETPVKPGEIVTLRLLIFDEGDHILDSAVLLDGLRWGFQPIPAPALYRP